MRKRDKVYSFAVFNIKEHGKQMVRRWVSGKTRHLPIMKLFVGTITAKSETDARSKLELI